MTSRKIMLYHVHRKGLMDNLWAVGNNIVISDNFVSNFWSESLEEEKIIINEYGQNYDIDCIISMFEDAYVKGVIPESEIDDYEEMLSALYLFRREKALEEGRKIYAPSAPSRIHSIFLTDASDLLYWEKKVGDGDFEVFQAECEGNIFVSSDDYFPFALLPWEQQAEASKVYWRPQISKNTQCKEFVFQGRCRLLNQIKH